jgi:hypothetical protein
VFASIEADEVYSANLKVSPLEARKSWTASRISALKLVVIACVIAMGILLKYQLV